MKIRDTVFLVIGGLLVISGMVLNSFLVTDADAQGVSLDGKFRNITCQDITIKDENGKWRGYFGLDVGGSATLRIFGDDGESYIAYLGENTEENGEMMLHLASKSKTDKRGVSMGIAKNGGILDCMNKMSESVVRLGVADDGGGGLDIRDKHGYTK